jgi:hypothetical protein
VIADSSSPPQKLQFLNVIAQVWNHPQDDVAKFSYKQDLNLHFWLPVETWCRIFGDSGQKQSKNLAQNPKKICFVSSLIKNSPQISAPKT